MTVAKNLGGYLTSILDAAAANLPIGTPLADDFQKESYASAIRSIAASGHEPTNMLDHGKATYLAVLNMIDAFIGNRGCGTGISPTLWRHLKTLVQIHGDKRDWANLETGPLFAARNDTLAARLELSIDRTKHVLRDLRKLGLVIYHNHHANGLRRIRRTQDGRAYGSGYSLLPLIIRLEALQELAAEYIVRKAKAIRLIPRARAALRQARSIICASTDEDHPSRTSLAAIQATINKAAAERDAATLEDIERDLCPEKTTPRRVGNDTPQSTVPISRMDVDRFQKARSETSAPKPAPDRPTDPYGIDAAALSLSEIPTLFPVAADYLPVSRDVIEAGQRLATAAAIPDKLWKKANRRLGPLPAALATIVYAQHLADGHIRNAHNPASYFAGMLRLGETGDLNLGASIWGRREATGTHLKRSPTAA